MLHFRFPAFEPSGSEEDFFYFYGSNLGPLAGAILDPGTSIRTNVVKDHQEMLHKKTIQAPEPSSSGKEDSNIYFNFEPKTVCHRAILLEVH